MTDGTGSTTYSYDSLSRLTSESRTFTGFGGTYALNYLYNLANGLTNISIPFRSQQIGYTYDTANRISGVTASGFTAKYYAWPNQYTQNVSSFASNITYRASGARKSMTYGNSTSEQTTYNARLQPATYTLNNMNYQNTNVCCNYPTYSTMTWSYAYYADGSVEHAWDVTNDWFDRAYKYDHAGRVTEASTYRRARGLSPFPSVPNRDPYFQSITYDVWNHSSRTGLFYTAEPSDMASYANNRRVGSGWEYDADGHTTRDSSYVHTFDAAGADTKSASVVMIYDGFPEPLPQVDISQTYDGAGRPGKRVQISRQAAYVDQYGTDWPAFEDTQTTYYVRSSVLGGAAVVELHGPGATDTVNVYAGGQRIARDIGDNIMFEHHNPVTGSWAMSLGHSTYRTTYREERDVRGAEIPTSNPYAWAEGYSEWKFGSPLYVEGGDPADYSSGRSIDGLPVSEAEFQRRVGKDVGAGAFVNGKSVGFVDLTGRTSLSQITVTFDVFEPSIELVDHPELWEHYYKGSFYGVFDLSGSQTTPKPKSTKSQKPVPFSPNQNVIKIVDTVLANPSCFDFLKTVLNKASTEANSVLHGGDIKAIFADFLGQKDGGVIRGPLKARPYGSASGKIGSEGKGDGVIYSNYSSFDQDRDDASTIVNELPHLAGIKGGWPNQSEFGDLELARATFASGYDRFYSLKTLPNPFSIYPTQKAQEKNRTSNAWSSYFHNILRQLCPMP